MVDLRTLLPLDEETILRARRSTGKVIVLHEATRTGGPGGEVAALIAERAFEYLDAPVRAGRAARHAGALLAAARGVLPAERRQGRPRRAGAGRLLTGPVRPVPLWF